MERQFILTLTISESERNIQSVMDVKKNNMCKTIIIEGATYKKATVRKDLLSLELGVPVGLGHIMRYDENKSFPYRWKDDGDEVFEIFYQGEWQEAESIDWDFS